MNKDGVPFGVMTGTLAVMETLCGFTGSKNLLEADAYRHYLDDLNEDYEIMKLYFKPYTCCRWAHPAIDACLDVMRNNNISYKDISHAAIHTFKGAAMLSKVVPETADEAQYNIAYPVAAAIVTGDFGFDQITAEAFENPEILSMMNKLSFYTDAEIDAQFPERRICRAVITTNDYKQFVSSECEPRGEAKENIGIDWISEKFKRITSSLILSESQDHILHLMTESLDLPVRSLIDEINDKIIG